MSPLGADFRHAAKQLFCFGDVSRGCMRQTKIIRGQIVRIDQGDGSGEDGADHAVILQNRGTEMGLRERTEVDVLAAETA